MGLTVLGLISSSAAAIAVPEPGYDVLRAALYISAAAFGTLAVMHFGAAAYHALVHTVREGSGVQLRSVAAASAYRVGRR